MTTATESKIRDLKNQIKRETNPLEKANLQFALKSLVRDLARSHEQEQVRRFAGNAY